MREMDLNTRVDVIVEGLVLRSQQSMKYRSRVKIRATVLENILRRSFMPGLMIVGIIVCEKWTYARVDLGST